MSSFFAKSTGVSFGDPPYTAEGGKRMYNWMRGYLPYPSTMPLGTWEDANGNPRFFIHAGDPVTGQGDIDGLGIGDSVEVVYAIVGAAGGDRIRNIDYLRWHTRYIRQAYPDLASLRQLESEEPSPTPTLPDNVALWTNYPNPFNAGTTIRFDLPEAVHVRLAVYDLLGRRMSTLVDATVQAGTHAATWNGTNGTGNQVASGIYFYRLEAKGMAVTKRMIFQK